jgi:uncharacterized membrane protein YeaQ/YmgE (transglycosylase-associated protein family)
MRAMSFLSLLWLAVLGLAIGALGRLVIPGKNPMATWMTAVVGIIGGVGGGAITQMILGSGHGFVRLTIGVACAALLVVAIASWQRTRGEGT